MRSLLPSYFFFFLIFPFSTISFAQEAEIQLSGIIVDRITQLPIPYSTVEVDQKGLGYATGDGGQFYLLIKQKGISLKDTLRFRALGYEEQLMTIQQFIDNQFKRIALRPQAILIEPVDFVIGDKKLVLGVASNEHGGPAYSIPAGLQVAVFMANPNQLKGVIQSISYFIVKDRKYKAPFRVRLWAVDEDGRPGKDLLTENIIIQAQTPDAWLTVDLEKYQIPIPENGYFAGLETIYTKKKYQFKAVHDAPGHPKEIFVCQGPVLATNFEEPVHLTWLGRLGKDWFMN
ncbi:MAG: hypothetical protein AAF705_15775, partial [Bacteroidota bacterium]